MDLSQARPGRPAAVVRQARNQGSLQTEVYAEAKVRRNEVALKWDRIFAQRRRQISFDQIRSDIIRYVAEHSKSQADSVLKASNEGRAEAVDETNADMRLYRDEPDSEVAQDELARLKQTIFRPLAIESNEMPVAEFAPPDIRPICPKISKTKSTNCFVKQPLNLPQGMLTSYAKAFPREGIIRFLRRRQLPCSMLPICFWTTISHASSRSNVSSPCDQKPIAAAKARGARLGGFRGRAGTCNDLARARAVRTAKADHRASDLAATIELIRSQGAISSGEIAKALNVRGITASRGGDWCAAQVRRILARPAFTAASR
jgi:hypothetical protein